MMQRLEDLIRAERTVAPEADAEARIWAAVEHRLAHGPPPPGAEAGPAALGGGAKATLVKLVAGALLVAGGGALLVGRGASGGRDRSDAAADARAREEDAREDMPSASREEEAAVAGGGAVQDVRQDGSAGAGAVAGGGAVQDVREDRSAGAGAGASALAGAGGDPGGGAVQDVREDRSAPAEAGAPLAEKRRRRTAPRAEEAAEAAAPLETDFTAELQLIAELRAALRGGDGAAALAKVEEHVRRFGSGGQLAQEREALRVEALCAAGRTGAAKRAAEALLQRWPDTTHAPRVKQSCAGT